MRLLTQNAELDDGIGGSIWYGRSLGPTNENGIIVLIVVRSNCDHAPGIFPLVIRDGFDAILHAVCDPFSIFQPVNGSSWPSVIDEAS